MTAILAEPSETRRVLVTPRLPPRFETRAASPSKHFTDSDPVTSRVLAALFENSTRRRSQERRSERRHPYPHPIYLTPLTADGPLFDETVQVLGKHLSEHGLDFYHREPLPYRRMIASLQADGQWFGLVLDLKWCRFTSDGLYDNGGRFVAAAISPLASDS